MKTSCVCLTNETKNLTRKPEIFDVETIRALAREELRDRSKRTPLIAFLNQAPAQLIEVSEMVMDLKGPGRNVAVFELALLIEYLIEETGQEEG